MRRAIHLWHQTCHMVRFVRIQYGFWPFLRWYGRITLWYGFQATYGWTILSPVECSKTSFVIDTTTFSSAKFPDRYDRSAFSSVIDWSKYIFPTSAGQSIVSNRGWRFPIRPYGDRTRTRSRWYKFAYLPTRARPPSVRDHVWWKKIW